MNSDFKELLTILNDCQVEYLVVPEDTLTSITAPLYEGYRPWIQPTLENALKLREALHIFSGWFEGMTLEHFTAEPTSGREQDLRDVAGLERVEVGGE